MITHTEYTILKSALRLTRNTISNGYYVDPRKWQSWESVIELLQDSGYLAYELTDDGKNYGYRVDAAMVSIAIKEYKIAQTYTPSRVFEAFIENELSFGKD